MRFLVGNGRAGGEEGLGDGLGAEDAREAVGLADDAEAVVAPRLELEGAEQPVERDRDGAREGVVGAVSGRRKGRRGC